MDLSDIDESESAWTDIAANVKQETIARLIIDFFMKCSFKWIV